MTPKKGVIGIYYVQHSLQFARMITGVCLGPRARLIRPGYGDRDHNQSIILELDVSQGGG